MTNEITYFNAWLLFSILAGVVAIVAASIVGFVLGFILGMVQINPETISIICGIVGFIIGLYCSFYFYKWSINKYILPQTE